MPATHRITRTLAAATTGATLALTLAACGGASEVDWVSPAHGFSVTFPGKPHVETIQQAVGSYTLELETASWSKGESEMRMTGAVTVPEEVLASQTVDEFLENSLAGGASSAGGTLASRESFELDGAPALRGTIDVPNKGVMGIVIALDGQDQIQLLSYPAEALDGFIESFTH